MSLNNSLFFDTETLSLNPYGVDNRMILAQIGYFKNDELKIDIFKEWEIGELNLVNSILNTFELTPRYTPVFTYNGLFDILYLVGRCNILEKSHSELGDISSIFTSYIKHCDLMQYNNGYLVSLDNLCYKYGIKAKCPYSGKDITMLYGLKRYDDIIAHGIDDIERLYKLVVNTKLADRFYKLGI